MKRAAALSSPAAALSDQFAAAISALSPPLPWAIAVSGGPDSLALMHLAAAFCTARNLPKPHVLTFDHRLRAASTVEARKVREWAGALGLDHTTLTHAGPLPDSGVQAFARRARYQAMGAFCAERGIPSLMLAHHLDDLHETIAMRAERGAPLANDGMAMMARLPDVAGADVLLVRPLLFETKAALAAHVQAQGQEFFSDPSNRDQRFERARLRLTGAAYHLPIADILAARQARAALERAAAALFDQHVRVHEAGFYLAPRDILLARAAPAQRLLRELMARVSGADYLPAADAIQPLQACVAESGAATLHGAQLRQAPRALAGPDHLMICVETPRAPVLPVAAAEGPFIWQRRFDVSVSGSGVSGVIVPLGLEGVARLRRQNKALRDIPSRALAMVPALVCDGDLRAAPLAGVPGPMSARFRGRPWFAYAAFPQSPFGGA